MAVDLKFKIEINLQSFTAVAIATTLWDHPKIKTEIKNRFEKARFLNVNFDPKDLGWRTIVEKVSQYVDLLPLTEDALQKVKGIIELIGDKIFYWNIYLLAFLKVDSKYAEKLYWTPYGSIDENKIFKLYWSQMEEVKELALDRVFLCSAIFAQEEFVLKNINVMSAYTMEAIKSVKMNSETLSPYAVIVIWMCIFTAEDVGKGIELYKKLKKSKKVAFDICKDSMERGLHLTAKYFWFRLKEKEREAICDHVIRRYAFTHDDMDPWEEEGYVQIMINVLNDLSPEKRHNVILKNFETVFLYLVTVWPYQKLLVQLIDAYIDYLTIDQLEFLYNYTLESLTDYKVRLYIDTEVNAHILCQVLRKIPREKKLNRRLNNFLSSGKCFKNSYVSVLGVILNDRDFLDQKEKFLQRALPKLKNSIKLNDLDLLITVVENVLPSKDDQKNLKLKLNVAQDLINSGNIDLADKLLSWIADTDEEKIRLKKEIDPLKFCIDSKNFKCEMLEKFLYWQCGGEEEKTKLKDVLKDIDFIKDKIIKIWNANDKVGESQCFQFFKLLTATEAEALQLKNNVIVDEQLILTYCNTLPSLNSFRRIDALLGFFSATPEKVLQIKKEIVKNIHKWVYLYIVTQKNFKLAEIIVNYVCNDEDEKKTVLVKYINSNSGAGLILGAYANYNEEHDEGLLFLLNNWVKLYGNVRVIKKNVSSFKTEKILETVGKFALERIWDKIGRGFEIDQYDLYEGLRD